MSRTATLRNLILKAKHAYYYSGEPVMSDAEYDALEDELRLLDPSDPVLGLVGSPVPPDTMLTKARHSLPMGSQSKVNSEEEFRSWCPKNEVQAIHASLKGDGASAAAYYRDGRMVQAISRGDGTVGEDITANAMRFKGLPAWVGTQDVGFSGAVRFEVILTVEDWTRIDPTRSKNPRNAGTGIMGRKNGNQSDCLTIFAFDLDETIDGQSVDFPTEAQKTLRLAELGFNPISYAIYDNADDVVEYFRNIAAKADLNVKNDQQDTPLMGAVESGSISIVRMLIDAGANADDKDFDGNTALRRAISSDKHIFDIIEYLINSSGNVNLQDDSGGSCLSKAVMTGRNELVQPLIAAGADVNLKDEEDRSALAYAVKSEKLSLETIKALVDAGAVVDNIDVEGETALFAAFARDNKDLTQYLISWGASVHAKDKDGMTLLMTACKSGSFMCIPQLVREGAGVDVQGPDKQTALMFAVANEKCVKAMLAAKADEHARDNDKNTALIHAIKHGWGETRISVVTSLIKSGSDVSAVDLDGMTALHLAAADWSNAALIDTLVGLGANPNSFNKKSQTPLMLCRTVDSVKELLKHSPLPDLQDSEGKTALIHAAEGYRAATDAGRNQGPHQSAR